MYNKKYNKIIFDVIIGSILIGLISYATLLFDENPEYLKIVAFLWAVPIIYFYFVYITYEKGSFALKSFTKHGFLGQILTVIIMLITYLLLLYNVDLNTIILINLVYGLMCIFVYFYFRLFNKF